ncbi:exodeoxyribonuclease VII small subunit [Proteiniborus sp.]|uniref:exodeoxyribonuclease VII small subunit n=1 Tax=Proteiniborus sp. TaxID=2079015 RepID=UPI00331B2CE5
MTMKVGDKLVRKKQSLSFEEAMLELESILSKLESGNLSLNDSLNEFSNGVELYKYCYELLNKVEGKVKIILEKNNDDFEELDYSPN